MHKRITILRADVERDVFVAHMKEALEPGIALWVTEAGPRPATAVVFGPPPEVGRVLATYTVEEAVRWDEPITGPVHSMFALFRFPETMDARKATANYRDHAQLAREHHPGVRRYCQDIVLDQSGEKRWMFSAISELHFAGAHEYHDRFWLREESRSVIARDVERFSEATTAKMLVAPAIERA